MLVLKGSFPTLIIANADRLVYARHENLAIPDLARLSPH